MNYVLLIIALLSISINGVAQFDTIRDFRERFFVDDKLVVENHMIKGVKNGLWIEYFDKSWNPCEKHKHKFYRLIEYSGGIPAGKSYDFYKSGKLQMIGHFKSVDPDSKSGSFAWYEKNGKVTSMEYHSDTLRIKLSSFKNGNKRVYEYQDVDSLFQKYYYKNGKPWSIEIHMRGKNRYSYENQIWYHKNGEIRSNSFYDKNLDSSYHYITRKNGTVVSEQIFTKNRKVNISEDKNGKTLTKWIHNIGTDSSTTEIYQEGVLVSSTMNKIQQPSQTVSSIPVIVNYDDKFGEVLAVIIVNDKYTVNNQEMTKSEYEILKVEYDLLMKNREQLHLYKQYSSDSLLIYEGLFKEGDLPCGFYKSYYTNGNLKISGRFDKKGRKTSVWYYYDEKVLHLRTEIYNKGEVQ